MTDNDRTLPAGAADPAAPRPWYAQSGPQGDVVLSSRVRLARNLQGLPFPGHMSAEQTVQLYQRAQQAADGAAFGPGRSLTFYNVADLADWRRMELVQHRLMSVQLAQKGGGLLLSGDEQVSIMLCEEDHLRIQVMNAGLSLKKCWQQANLLDDYFDSRLEFSFDEKLGYLTHCPTNLGTGMRASVLMHLPALEHTGYLQELVGVAHKLGLTIRGAYGEGTGGERSMYQISNQHSLGLSEGQILENLQAVVEQIAERERAERQLYCKDQLAFCDRVYRSLGVLQYARLLTHQEVMEHCGVLRLGCSLGLCPELTLETLSHIEAATGTGAILQTAPQATTHRQQDKLRADLVRQIISGSAARPAAPGGRA